MQWESLFLLAESVHDSHVDAEVVLDAVAEGGADVGGRHAEGEVGVEIVVAADTDGEGRLEAVGPESEQRRRNALRAAGKDAPADAAEGLHADCRLLVRVEAVAAAAHE